MCGIAGFLNNINSSPKAVLKSMVNAISHRGPDGNGIWYDNNSKIGIGHARLSILDLTSAATQPMTSQSMRYVISFNGEIYNHWDLRYELNKVSDIKWSSSSDTETLVELINSWGIEHTLLKVRGMFAIAIWDNIEKTLYLTRDRMGEKPLYYGWINGVWGFSSELKSLKKLPQFNNKIDHEALGHYVRLGHVPSPLSIYENVFKVEPGTIVSLKSSQKSRKIINYWSTKDEMFYGSENQFIGSDYDAEKQLEQILSNAVSMQMLSDVPLGAFLSGGIDSSLICALMQSNSNVQIDTCSIGFGDKKYNEAEHARKIANFLKTNHFDLYVTGDDALNVIPLLPEIYDEPFADSSQIPTYLVSKIAKKSVTVALTGDGGDELFGGYNRYILTQKYWKRLSVLPIQLRKFISICIQHIPINQIDFLLSSFLSSKFTNLGDKINKGADAMIAENIDQLYMRLLSQITSSNDWLKNNVQLPCNNLVSENIFKKVSDVERMMITDLVGYLPNDILTKVDRAAMAVSLETRVPFLDPNVIRFAASLPLHMKIRDGNNKWILKQILYKHIPKNLIDRPKMGFSVPLDQWLRGPLKDWAEKLLEPKKIEQQGFFKANIINEKWKQHQTGFRNWQYQLWNILIFQQWLEHNN